jgi:inorganic pyrophosphatase
MIIKVCIQVAAGSREKRRYNEKTLEYKGMSRGSLPYPYPYGFILGTSGADGDNLDCYLITRERLQAGTIVECEPIGLLEQDEDGEIDHKVLAATPGQDVEAGQALQQELRDFIYAVFRQFPDVHVHVGELLPRQAALDYIQECLEA